MQVFWLSLVIGLMMICAEVFVPGGILGLFGCIALFTAMVAGYAAYPGWGNYISLAIITGGGIIFVLWIKFLPKSAIGRALTLRANGTDRPGQRGPDATMRELENQTGEAQTDLRPSGIARIAGRRVDVITEGSLIPKGEQVRVVEVKGSKVVVTVVKKT